MSIAIPGWNGWMKLGWSKYFNVTCFEWPRRRVPQWSHSVGCVKVFSWKLWSFLVRSVRQSFRSSLMLLNRASPSNPHGKVVSWTYIKAVLCLKTLVQECPRIESNLGVLHLNALLMDIKAAVWKSTGESLRRKKCYFFLSHLSLQRKLTMLADSFFSMLFELKIVTCLSEELLLSPFLSFLSSSEGYIKFGKCYTTFIYICAMHGVEIFL